MAAQVLPTPHVSSSKDFCPSGEPKMLPSSCSCHDAVLVPRFSLQLPSTVYGSAILAATFTDRNASMLAWWANCGTALFFLLLNDCVQSLMLVQLYQLVQWNRDVVDSGTECTELYTTFFWTYLGVFFCATLTEMQETWDLFLLIAVGIPTVSEWSDSLKFDREEDGSLTYASGGMTYLRKAVLVILVIVPKYCFGVSLTIIGGWFLQNSATNADLALNSLAVVFILEVDEMIFAYLLPASMRRLVEAMPSFDKDHPGYWYRVFEAFVPVLKILLALVLVAFYWFTGNVCENDPCQGSLRECPVMRF
eukprot:TRINITY_DN92836_c0_g1_i1.p1 TRINITY_DN92836_c0_g1~~TRINITY_DN92836_c0_g1_i1.p1  ORF type:complete len:322 (+),score=44.91 TRINITY_DN92836_c0_g1_i1:46-966(+)